MGNVLSVMSHTITLEKQGSSWRYTGEQEDKKTKRQVQYPHWRSRFDIKLSGNMVWQIEALLARTIGLSAYDLGSQLIAKFSLVVEDSGSFGKPWCGLE